MAWSCTVLEAKARCTFSEFHQWVAYYEIEPFGEERADLRNAILAATVARIGGNKNAEVSDFMPTFTKQRKKQTTQEQANLFAAFAKAHNESMSRG